MRWFIKEESRYLNCTPLCHHNWEPDSVCYKFSIETEQMASVAKLTNTNVHQIGTPLIFPFNSWNIREGHYNRLVLRSISASFDNGVSPIVSKWTIKWEMKGHNNIIIITNLCLKGN